MRFRTPLAAATLAAALLPAVTPAAAQTFTDVTELFPGLPASGLGNALVDLDGDGRTDLIHRGWLYRASGGAYQAIPALAEAQEGLGALVFDVDNDGLREVAMLGAFEPVVRRYDRARASFVDLGAPLPWDPTHLIQGSAVLDYDRDGLVDLLVGNDNAGDRLYRNLGDGQFAEAGAAVFPQVGFGTYGLAVADYDRDGDTDVYVGICTQGDPARLFRNDGAAGFTEVAAAAGATNGGRMAWGVAWLDYDNDGWLDLFVVNSPLGTSGGTAVADRLYRNLGDGTFEDVAESAGVLGGEEAAWSVTAADFDNDGWLDLFVSAQTGASRYYRNLGDGTFADATASAGLAGLTTFPVAAGDLDRDGWMDLATPGASSGKVWRNTGGTNAWLAVRLRGVASNRDGIGARVEVTAGGQTQVREISGGDGFMSHSYDLAAHVGLGTATAADVTVRWPSGQVDTYAGLAANQSVTLVEGVGRNEAPAPFALAAPASGTVAPTAPTLAWSAAADAEGDAVAYTVHLAGEDADATFETTETQLALPVLAEGSYRWTVVARDAFGVRTALDPFSFTVGTVAGEPGPDATVLALRAAPNPSSGSVAVGVEAPPGATVRVAVVDALGREVALLAEAARAGDVLRLAARRLAPGAYVVVATGPAGTARVPLTLAR